MFHSTRSPITNPREKYLAALAEAKAAEAEYLAAERLQQEEDSLRQRLEQIQLLKQHNTPQSLDANFGSFYTPAEYSRPAYPQAAPLSRGPDLELLRRQIATEERARIAHEQQQARELEALRKQQLAHERQIDAQRKKEQQAREEAFRVEEALRAREAERTRALAAQRAHLAALTQRASEPAVRFIISNDGPKRQHCRAHQARRPELDHAADLTRYLTAAQPQAQAHAAFDPTEVLQALFAGPKAQKETQPEPAINAEDFFAQLFGGRGQQQQAKAPTPAPAPAAPQAVSLEQLLSHLIGVQPSTPAAAPQPEADTNAVGFEQLLNHILGRAAPQPSASTAAPQPKADTKPQQPATAAPSQAPITLEQLLNHFLGAAGVEQAQPSTSTAQQPTAGPSQKKETAPAPAPSTSAPAPAPKPAAQSTAPPQATGFEHILNQFLGGAAAHPSSSSTQPDIQQLMNMFMGHGHPAPKAPEPSSSKPASGSTSSESALKQELEARLRSQQSSEERDLAEAIRMSLAEAAVAPAPADPKGKAPAPAPVKDVTTSTAEVHSIDAAFTTLSAEFAFPAELDFSTSRPASPVRAGAGAAEGESVMAKLSYSARNQGVRFYQQGLSGLLAQLDAVESFGDEELRHARKEVVGRVEGALDELERVVEARWRKFAGRVERVEAVAEPESASVPVPVESAAPAPVESAAESVEEAPVIVDAEEVPAIEQAELVIDTVEPTVTTSAVAESSPAAEVAYPPVSESSYPPAVESPAPDSSSYPPSESVETLRPAESPAPSDIDTFLLPAESAEAPAKKPRASEEDVGSDWSEVDA